MKLPYSAIDNILTYLLPAGEFFQLLSILKVTTTVNKLFMKLSYSAIDNVLTNLLPASLQDFSASQKRQQAVGVLPSLLG